MPTGNVDGNGGAWPGSGSMVLWASANEADVRIPTSAIVDSGFMANDFAVMMV
jgi:hypothetical protein